MCSSDLLTECDHGFPSRSVKTVNIGRLSNTGGIVNKRTNVQWYGLTERYLQAGS